MRSIHAGVFGSLLLLAMLWCCPAARAEEYYPCSGGCKDCLVKETLECWGAPPNPAGGPAPGAIYKCGTLAVTAVNLKNSGIARANYCYPKGCWIKYKDAWTEYRNACNTAYKQCCQGTAGGSCKVFYKHVTNKKWGFPEGYRPPGQ